MQASEHLVREFQLKTKLSVMCNRILKEYARKKINKNTGNQRLKTILEAFINQKMMTFRYSILLTVIFGREFDEIKARVLKGTYSLDHISHENYWNKNNIKLADAIFFSYTFYSEAYPEGEEVLRAISEMTDEDPTIDIMSTINSIVEQYEREGA